MSTDLFPGLAASSASALGSLPRHNRDLTLRRFLLLQEEHESISRHLDELSTTAASSSATITQTTSSPAQSPTRGHKRVDLAARRASLPQYDAPRPCFQRRRRGGVDRTTMDVEMRAEVASEEARLFTINEGIKRSLTELLNCETVRADQTFRQWIMARLLEVEKELRVGRRRRSCPSG